MKKLLYLIPLFIFLFIILPKDVSASTTHKYILVDSPITEEQKQEYLDYVFNSEEFQNNFKNYKYYMIFYNKGHSDFWSSYNYNNRVVAVFYNDLAYFDFNRTSRKLGLKGMTQENVLIYNTNDNMSLSINPGAPQIDIIKYSHMEDSVYVLNFKKSYILSTNFVYSTQHTVGYDTDLYDSSGNYIRTLSPDENLFEGMDLMPQPEIESNIDSILNSEDVLYSLSKELLGYLPEEFTFLYSLVQLFLGIVIFLVVLSPIILLLRIFR